MAEERIPLIETVDLKKYFKVGDKSFLHAVDGINMKVYAGETIGVVGESGCGKSTLGRTILRLIEPTSGQILYNGDDITKYNTRQMKKMRQELQIIFQDPYASLDPRKSVIEIIAEYLLCYGISPRAGRRSPSAYRHCPCAVRQPQVHRLRRACFRSGCLDSGTDPQPADGPAG